MSKRNSNINGKRNSVLLVPNNLIEEKTIEEALKTPFDIVMEILHNIEKYLRKTNKNLANDINIVINIIRSQKLYNYQALDENYKIKEIHNPEMQNIIGHLKQYSQKKFNFVRKSFQTSKFNEIPQEMKNKFNLQIDSNFKFDESDSENSDILFDDYLSDDEDNSHHLSNLSSISKKMNSENKNPINISLKKNKKHNVLNISHSGNSFVENELLDIHFNIFSFYPERNKNIFLKGSFFLMKQFDTLSIIKEKTLKNFLNVIYDKYSSSTAIYHTERHALDILQTVYIYTFKTDVISMINLTYLDILSLGIASLCHDLSHPGYSNDYLIRSNNNIALDYNDIHVLENYHISQMFHIINKNNDIKYNSNDNLNSKNNNNKDRKKNSYNIFDNLQIEDYRLIRKRIVDLILATDMQNHSKVCTLMKNFIQNKENKSSKYNYNMTEQQDVMNFLIHTADISHCSKDFDISFKWTNLLNEEFWREGDEEKEKKMQVGFLCDRNNSDTPSSQVGFIKGIILPTFDILYNCFSNEDILFYINNVRKNLEEWNKRIVKKK